MKKAYLIIVLSFTLNVIAFGQRYIQTDAHQMAIMDVHPDERNVSYLDPIRSDDPVAIRLYKQYFNPVSFNSYRNFFLPDDWGGFSQSDFDTWQAYLRKNTIKLDKTMQIQDESSHEFIVCHYSVESEYFIMPSTAIFKKVGQGWKHISFINDPEAKDLKAIGMIKTEAISSLRNGGGSTRLSNLERNHTSEVIEKFDRSALFEKGRSILVEKGVSVSDMELSKQLFEEKAEVEMVKFIASSYELDVYNLMGELNDAFGFRLYRFVNTVKRK